MKYWMCLLIAVGIIGIPTLLCMFFDWLKYDAPEWVKIVFTILSVVFVLSLFLYKIAGLIQ